jgi:RimJ/RimL family protein N-acetyltransferase
MVTLRPWTPGDVPEVTLACRDPEIVRWTTQIPEDYTEEHARSWIESTSGGWARGNAEFAITETQTSALAGAIGLFARESWVAEIGYWMAAPFRNRGLATRALSLVSDWGHSLGFVRLQLMMLPGNEASARIAAKAGFNEELAGPGPTSRTREGVATGATRQARPSERTQACRVARNTPRRSCTQDLLARIARMSYLPAAGTAGR